MFLQLLYQQKTIENCQNVLVNGLDDQGIWNEYETKSENRNATNEYRYSLESSFEGANRLFVLIYSSRCQC